MARRTKADALATRNHILDTAELVFERRGVARTSLAEIATAAGVTRGAIYWHFRDKAAVFDAMMERMLLPLEVAAADGGPTDSEDDEAGDPRARIRADVEETLRRIVGDPRMQRVIEIALHKVEYVDEFATLRERGMAVRRRRIAQLESDFDEARRLGRLADGVAARQCALGLVALIDGLIQHWIADRGAFEMMEVGRQTVDRYLAGCFAPCRASAAARSRSAAISPP